MAVNDQDKVFAPTPRRRRQAREQGRVVISPDLVSGMLLLALTGILHVFGHRLIDESGTYLRGSLEQIQTESFDSPADLSSHLTEQFGSAAGYFLVRLWPFWMLPLIAIITVLMQTRGLFHWPAVAPAMDRINPATGLQRLSFPEIFGRLLGTSLKVAGLGSIAWFWTVRQHKLDTQPDLVRQTQAELDQGVMFLFALSLGMLAWGMVDYFFRRRRFEKQLRMTARELANEQKQFNPDPALGRRTQELRTQMTNTLSLNQTTDLLITDGLAAGVLLRFDPQTQSVPTIVARQTGAAGVQLLQRCLQSRTPIYKSTELQQELSRVTDHLLPDRFWPQIAELLGRHSAGKYEMEATGEPAKKERVSSSETDF